MYIYNKNIVCLISEQSLINCNQCKNFNRSWYWFELISPNPTFRFLLCHYFFNKINKIKIKIITWAILSTPFSSFIGFKRGCCSKCCLSSTVNEVTICRFESPKKKKRKKRRYFDSLCVLTQYQEGKTSAMILETQSLAHISLEKVLKPFSNNFEIKILHWKRLFTSRNYSRQLSVFPEVDVLANLPKGQAASCSEI